MKISIEQPGSDPLVLEVENVHLWAHNGHKREFHGALPDTMEPTGQMVVEILAWSGCATPYEFITEDHNLSKRIESFPFPKTSGGSDDRR